MVVLLNTGSGIISFAEQNRRVYRIQVRVEGGNRSTANSGHHNLELNSVLCDLLSTGRDLDEVDFECLRGWVSDGVGKTAKLLAV